jgi:protein TonB
MDLPARIHSTITRIELIPIAKPPPEPTRQSATRPALSQFDAPIALVPVPQPDHPVDSLPPLPPLGSAGTGVAIDPPPIVDPLPLPSPVRLGPRLATPSRDLKPPYPLSKLTSEEEAVLKLRLTIDQRGRVIAVDPVGTADPAFLDAARRHLMARWHYQPASEDGRAIASATVITLRFQLDE